MKIRRSSIEVTRLQFPLRLAYAMTFNRAQGQTLGRVLIDSKMRVLNHREVRGAFTHGQLYVALGRVRELTHVAILVDTECTHGGTAMSANVVFHELLGKLE